ncbi:MAG: cupin domain-containing protein [Saprospiraceae bacterium]
MIKQDDKISNPRTGQTMLFLKTAAETNGEVLQIECVSPPSGVGEPEHIHPKQESFVKMISGSCTFSIDGREQILNAGQTLTIQPNVRHHFWND